MLLIFFDRLLQIAAGTLHTTTAARRFRDFAANLKGFLTLYLAYLLHLVAAISDSTFQKNNRDISHSEVYMFKVDVVIPSCQLIEFCLRVCLCYTCTDAPYCRDHTIVHL